MKIARGLLFVVFVLLFVPVTQALSEMLTTRNWDDVKAIFINNPMIAAIIAIPIICLVLILLFIHKIDKWEGEKAEKRHAELLEAIKNNRPIIFRKSSHGARKYKHSPLPPVLLRD